MQAVVVRSFISAVRFRARASNCLQVTGPVPASPKRRAVYFIKLKAVALTDEDMKETVSVKHSLLHVAEG